MGDHIDVVIGNSFVIFVSLTSPATTVGQISTVCLDELYRAHDDLT